MQFSPFPQANDVLRAAPGTEHYVQDLHIFRQQPYVASCVDFTADEVAAILDSGQVYLQLDGNDEATAEGYAYYFKRFAIVGSFEQVADAAPMLASFAGANVGTMLFMQPLLPERPLGQDEEPCGLASYALPEADLLALGSTGKLYVKALGTSHPPIRVYASNPLTFNAPAEPAAE